MLRTAASHRRRSSCTKSAPNSQYSLPGVQAVDYAIRAEKRVLLVRAQARVDAAVVARAVEGIALFQDINPDDSAVLFESMYEFEFAPGEHIMKKARGCLTIAKCCIRC